MSNVVAFPNARIGRPKPTGLSVEIDFNSWAIRFSFHGRFYGRRYFPSQAEARGKAERLVEKHGLTWDEPALAEAGAIALHDFHCGDDSDHGRHHPDRDDPEGGAE